MRIQLAICSIAFAILLALTSPPSTPAPTINVDASDARPLVDSFLAEVKNARPVSALAHTHPWSEASRQLSSDDRDSLRWVAVVRSGLLDKVTPNIDFVGTDRAAIRYRTREPVRLPNDADQAPFTCDLLVLVARGGLGTEGARQLESFLPSWKVFSATLTPPLTRRVVPMDGQWSSTTSASDQVAAIGVLKGLCTEGHDPMPASVLSREGACSRDALWVPVPTAWQERYADTVNWRVLNPNSAELGRWYEIAFDVANRRCMAMVNVVSTRRGANVVAAIAPLYYVEYH